MSQRHELFGQKMERINSVEEREEEYLSAQAAAVEAIDVGRETLTVAASQKEQLDHADKSADHAHYALDKSARVLRGMTWSGWVANMFSNDVLPPKTDDTLLRPRDYQDFPDSCRAAAQAIQNYRCNLLVLDSCETDEQTKTCLAVCDSAYKVAAKEIANLPYDNGAPNPAASTLAADLSILRDLQKRKTVIKTDADHAETLHIDQKSNTSKTASSVTSKQEQTETGRLASRQDEHLGNLSTSLGELNSIGRSLGQLMTDQNELLDSVSEKATSNIDKSKLVTRKADKLIQKKSWKPVPKQFHSWVTIRHIPTQKYLGVSNGALALSERYDPDVTLFGMWKRQGNVFGLQHKYSQRWAGQTLLGYLSCNATSFGNREEWEAYDDWERTRLLCASANWWSGAFIMVRNGDTLYLGGSNADEKNQADIWCIKEQTEDV